MGDVRYEAPYARLRDAEDRAAELQALEDEEVVAALAAASREHDPLLANVLATEAQDRTARTRRILSSVGDGVVVSRLTDGRIVDANPAAERMFGWSLEEFRGSTMERLHVDAGKFREFVTMAEDTLHRGETVHVEYELKRRNGEIFPAEHTVTFVRDLEGNPVGVVSIVRDVTERRRVEEELRRTNGLLNAVADNSTDGIFIKDASGRYLFANRAAAAVAGLLPGDLVGRDDVETLGMEAGSRLLEKERGIMEEGRWRHTEDTLEIRGERRHFHSAKGPFRDADGNVVGIIGLMRDITELKRAENKLRRWEHLFRHAEWGVAVGSADARTLLMMNPAFARMHGFTVEELTGRPVLDVFAPHARAAVALESRRAQETGHHAFESVHVRKDGATFPVLVDVTTVKDDAGQVLYQAFNVQDITARKAAETALRESEARYRTATEHAAIGMALVGLDGRFLEVNRKFCDLVGYSREELLRQTFQEITHPDDLDSDLAQVRQLADGRIDAYTLEKRYIRKDGRIVWIHLTGSPVRAPDGTAVYLIKQVQDITDRKITERRLAAQNGVAHVLAEPGSLEGTTERLLRVFCETLDWPLGEFWRLDRVTNRLRLAAACYLTPEIEAAFVPVSRGMTLGMGDGLAGLTWAAGAVVGIEDVRGSDQFRRREAATHVDLRCGFGIPVRGAGRLHGIMTFLGRDLGIFDADLERVMEAVGRQVGQFLDRLEAEMTTRRLLEAAPDATVVVDPGGLVRFMNARAELLFGWSADEVVGREVDRLLPERLRGHRALADRNGARAAGALELAILRRDGTQVPVEISVTAVAMDDGTQTIASIRPVRELRRPPTARPLAQGINRLRSTNRITGVVPILVGLAVLSGWWLDVPWLKTPLPGAPFMVANTALGFLLAGGAILLAPGPGRGARAASLALALSVIALGSLTLAQYATDADLGIDEILVRNLGEGDSPIPGRPSPQTAFAFVLVGAGAVMLNSERRTTAGINVLGLAVATLAIGSLVGYAFSAPVLYTGPGQLPYTGMAVHTALAFLMVAVNLLTARPTSGIAGLFVSDSSGGALARRLALPVLLMPIILGAAVLVVERSLGLGASLDLAVLALATMHAGGLVVWFTARSLDREDRSKRRAETLFRAILDGSPDAVFISDEHGNIRYANSEAERMFGYDPGALIGISVEALMPEGYRARYVQHRAGYGQSPRTRPRVRTGLDLRGLRKDGSEFPVEISLSPTQTGEGLLVTAAVRDVTERRRREAQMRRLAAIVEQTDDLVLVTDASGRIEYVNPSFEEKTGYALGEAVGKKPNILKSGVQRDAFYASLWRMITQGKPFRGEFVNRRKDGSLYDEDKTITPLLGPDGSIEFFVSTAKDVTERKRMAARATRMSRLWSVLAEANQAIFRADDRETLFRDVCDVAFRFGGFRMVWIGMLEPPLNRLEPVASAGHVAGYFDARWRDDASGAPGPEWAEPPVAASGPVIFNDVASEAATLPWAGEALERGYLAFGIFPIVVNARVLGTLNVYAATPKFFDEKEKRLLTNLASDVALALENMRRDEARAAAEERLRRANRDLEARVAERAKHLATAYEELDAFTYRVSHDLRGPLRGLDYFLQTLLKEKVDDLDEDALTYLRHAVKESDRMRGLIENLLRLSRSQTVEMRPVGVDAAELAESVVGAIRRRDPSRNVEVDIQGPIEVEADPDLLQIVLENLIGNAWKFTSRTEHPRIDVGGFPDEGNAVIFVRDNGAGFSPDDRHRLFKVFERLHAPTDFEGSGIGLATVARIVHRHGGSVAAEGKPGKGATFYVKLPRRRAADPE